MEEMYTGVGSWKLNVKSEKEQVLKVCGDGTLVEILCFWTLSRIMS
jgi:hypothetical protein